MLDQGPIYLDQDGYNRFIEEINTLESEIAMNNSSRKDIGDIDSRDSNNFAFKSAEEEKARLMGELAIKKDMLARVVIVEKHNEDTIDIGDIVSVSLAYAPDDTEETDIHLVGGIVDIFADFQEVSINSPLGSAIYRRAVGEKTQFVANGNVVTVEIKGKRNLGR